MTETDKSLLLLLARGIWTPQNERQLDELRTSDIDWLGLAAEAIEQGVHPLVCRNLQRLCIAGIPPAAQTLLSAAYRNNTARNLLLAHELENLLSRLETAGIPAIPLKGLPLAQSLYGDMTMRVCGDNDLLIPRSAIEPSLSILHDLGYEEKMQSRLIRKLAIRHGIEYEMARVQNNFRFNLDLHWDMFLGAELAAPAMDALWSEAKPFRFGRSAVRMLNPEWELLYLAVHAANHQWKGLKWLIDIHDVCSSRTLNGVRLNTLARRLKWDGILKMSLAYCHQLLDTPIPPELTLERLPPWAPAPSLTPRAERHRSAFGPDSVSFRLHLLNRRQKLRYMAALLFIPTGAEEHLLKLPESLSFLYYPLRPLRLLGRSFLR